MISLDYFWKADTLVKSSDREQLQNYRKHLFYACFFSNKVLTPCKRTKSMRLTYLLLSIKNNQHLHVFSVLDFFVTQIELYLPKSKISVKRQSVFIYF